MKFGLQISNSRGEIRRCAKFGSIRLKFVIVDCVGRTCVFTAKHGDSGFYKIDGNLLQRLAGMQDRNIVCCYCQTGVSGIFWYFNCFMLFIFIWWE